MITLEQVSFGYGKQKVIEELSVLWEKGGIHGLVGLNGAGKTTLLNGIYSLQKPRGGRILWEGRVISKKDIAYLETQNYFYDNITGNEYLRLFMHKNPSFAPAEWNKLFHLPLDKLISTYSTGMKKKLAFMGMLCLDRPVYMLDEPYNGVDLETTQHFKLIMKALKESGKTLILTSHIFESLTSICDTISYLQRGKIQFTLQRPEFPTIEERIFGKMNEENGQAIRKLIQPSPTDE